ncbi:MAG: hypothetical protein KQJ78_07155 [Deltaproteobacteria bacterium]|nr:hypothetical protein [Deltaproteobacteria bacterium]
MKKFFPTLALFAVAALLGLTALGCSTTGPTDQERAAAQATPITKMAVLPFERILPDNPTSSEVSCPVTGACYQAGDIAPEAEKVLGVALMQELNATTTLQLVPPDQSERVLMAVGGRRLDIGTRQQIAEMGRKVGADAVMACYVYRYVERVGGPMTAESPAAVTFDLAVVRSKDGQVIWKNSFDEKQQALSEDLLNVGQYMRYGLRWFSADELAHIGITRILQRFPWRKPGLEEQTPLPTGAEK